MTAKPSEVLTEARSGSAQVFERIQWMTELMADRTGAKSACLYLLDPVNRTLCHFPGPRRECPCHPEILGPFCRRALHAGTPLLLAPWLPPPDVLPGPVHQAGIEVLLLVPLPAKEELGVLALGSTDPRGFGWEQLQTIDQSREELVTTALLYRAERRLVTAQARLGTLTHFLIAFTEHVEPGERIAGLLKGLADLFMATSAAYFLYDPATQTLRIQRGYRLSPNHEQIAVFRLGQGIAGAAVASRQPILVNNVLEDPRLVYGALVESETIASVMCVPVMREGDVTGVVMLYSDRIEHFTEDDLKFLNALGLVLSSCFSSGRTRQAATPGLPRKQTKVLLIEDNPGDARLVVEALADIENAPFDIAWTDTLSSGLARLADGGIDVVLLDLMLPDSQGLQTLAEVHAQTPEVPIVVLTGQSDEGLAIQAVRAGAQDHLVKGQVDSRSLVRALRYAIERTRAQAVVRTLSAIDELTE